MPQSCTRSSGGSPSYLLPMCRQVRGRHGHYGMRPLQAMAAWSHDSLYTSRHYESLRSVRKLLQVNQRTAPNRANTSGTAIIGRRYCRQPRCTPWRSSHTSVIDTSSGATSHSHASSVMPQSRTCGCSRDSANNRSQPPLSFQNASRCVPAGVLVGGAVILLALSFLWVLCCGRQRRLRMQRQVAAAPLPSATPGTCLSCC